MVLVRTILATLIALSVAVLPAAGKAIVQPLTSQTVMADQADMRCCPRCNTQDHAKLTVCALKCSGLVGAVFPATPNAPLYLVRGGSLSFVDDSMREFLQPPPTHPPPV